MFSGPMFRREFRAAALKRRVFVFRIAFTIALAIIAALIGFFIYTAASEDDTPARLLYFGRSVFIATIGTELLFLVFFVPAHAAGAVAEEREKDTLPLLLLTRLGPTEIALTKAAARWLASTDVIFIGLPVLVVSGWLAGLQMEIVLTLLVLLSSSAFMTALAILASAQRQQVGPARAQAVAWIFAWLLMVPVINVFPIRTGTLWGDLLTELKRLCILVTPSSPLSLVTDGGWYYRPQSLGLQARVALMVGLQSLFGLLATGAAASRLQARERNPNWLDPTRGHRPRCGDDPIYWHEFELPTRRGAGPFLVIRLRYVWILVRALLMNLLALVVAVLAIAVPIGLLVATLYYRAAAFQERWQSGPSGPYDARSHFNLLVRAATGLLAFFPSLGLISIVAARITTERDKKTWEVFLATPLTGEEILRSKVRAALHGLWLGAWPLPLFWALGVACGAVLPIGVALAAVDLLLVVWADVALGLYLGTRPGTTNSIANWSALSMLVCLVSHAPLLAALLASPPEYAEFASWDPRLWWGIMLGGSAISILTAAIAWWATRRTIDRFDEWVGRPIPGARAESEGRREMPVEAR